MYIVWGSTYLAIRYAVETIPPFLMGGGRFLVSGAVLWAWVRFRGAPRPTSRQWRDASIAGVLMLCAGNGAVAWAEERVPSGLAALIVAVVPLWMVLLDWLRPRGTRPSALTMVGVVVGLAGLIVLIGPVDIDSAEHADLTRLDRSHSRRRWPGPRGPSTAGTATTRNRARSRRECRCWLAEAILVLTGIATGELSGFSLGQVSNASWIGWTYLVTFGSLVGFTAYVYLLNAVSPGEGVDLRLCESARRRGSRLVDRA